MDLSDATLQALRFEEVRTALASRTRTEAGKARAQARGFLPGRVEVLESLALTAEARTLRTEPLLLPLGGLTEIRPSLERASKGALLEPRELMAVTHALFAFERTSEALQARKDRLPGLNAIGKALPDLDALATRLERSIEPSGEVSDRASPALKEARDHARGLHRAIKARLDRLLHDEKFAANLREGYFSVRNERYVVPVLASSRAEIPGIVHNASQSGQTLFVEPTEMIGIGNDLAIAQSLVLEEERRVLSELSFQVGKAAGPLAAGVEASARLDELEAAAGLSEALNASPPDLQAADGPLELKGLRHPLLVLKGQEVVANDLELHEQTRALVVSGPNAGGKTVTLTAVGLSALMVRAGLPIAADPGSKLPLFNAVHSAIGDAQDLQAGLSTFSAHVSMLRDICKVSRRGSLVLVDEIAADTDPREGAAIAVAVLEDLLDRGAMVLVTTHLEELKALAHLDPRFVNARVGFDSRKMAPTYRLQLGAAGASSAIDIARRMGLAETICVRATALAQNAGGALSKALSAAEDERRKYLDAHEAAAKDAAEAKALREQLEAERAEVARSRKEEELKFRAALRAELEFARAQLRDLQASLAAKESPKAAEKASAELTERINEQTVAERTARQELSGEGPAAPLELKVGARAHHLGFGADVEILELDGSDALVAAGALKTRVPLSQLGPPRKSKQAKVFPASSASKQQAQLEKAAKSAPGAPIQASPRVDVRGMRGDEMVREVEQFLDRVSRSGDEAAIVLHGHGTGALKAMLREYLASSPYVKTFRAGESHEGGDGVTVVMLR
ncbi:MAG: mismatch repair protein MutS, type 2 family protein [Myxococcaceae bacterium]|nr:mismatch repair protein MutS, type 2 family protein [Myxococcaceae bacterium]